MKRIMAHNKDILELLVGSLLGKSYGEKRSNGIRFVLQQEEKNIEYLFWYHKYLAERGYCNIKKPKLETKIGEGGKIRYILRVITYTYQNLNWLYDLFYKNTINGNIKIIQPEIKEFISPLALSVWIMENGIMENGGKVSSGLKITRNSFTLTEVELLCDILNNLYNLDSRPNSGGKNDFIIYIPKKSIKYLMNITKPYIISSMLYKFNLSAPTI